jgi:hypothetical protein
VVRILAAVILRASARFQLRFKMDISPRSSRSFYSVVYMLVDIGANSSQGLGDIWTEWGDVEITISINATTTGGMVYTTNLRGSYGSGCL